MRRPVWRWTGWLSLGLAGCLHGQDWRAAVSKPMARPVADRHQLQSVPKVIGPVRGQQKFAAPSDVATSAKIAVRSAAPATAPVAPQLPPNHPVSPNVKLEPPRQRSKIIPVGHDVPTETPSTSPAVVAETPARPQSAPVAPAVASPLPSLVTEPSRAGGFAEFERTIPTRPFDTVSRSEPKRLREPVSKPVEAVVSAPQESEKELPLPVITPAGASALAKPEITPGSSSRTLEPEIGVSENGPRGLLSNSVPRAKELPDVTDSNSAPEKDSPSNDAMPKVRPQDVSVLVEQVFEDLRQRRLNEARQRTEWLKQLVKKREPAGLTKGAEEAAASNTSNTDSDEPRWLQVDPQATAIEKTATEAFFDDEESTN